MYRIEEPKYFILFVIIPIIALLFLWSIFWKKRTQKKFADSELLQRLAPTTSMFKSILKFGFLVIGLSFLIIGLTNPKIGTKLETVKRQGIDIVFALDVSKSMLAEDIAPNRLEKAKQIISKITDQLAGDRVGIIIYAGNSYPLLPITTDMAAAKMFLQNASPEMVSSQGTAISEAISRALTYYDNDEQTNRFLVLLSDGEDHEEDSENLAEKAKKEGIKIYTIGVGTEKGSPIPIKNGSSLQEYKKDQQGNVVITQRKSAFLEQIAERANGKYLDGNNTQKTVDAIKKIIDKAEKSEFETKKFSDYKDQFQWFIGIGLLLLLIDIFLFEKKTEWIQKLNLFNQNEVS
ncbi:MAG: VWA domain-containing protein [Flavobacteriaceae bacterium]|nr:VWA domain-containing protein [Flavobacteriaceae bacterium]